jgi:GntR family transcriptional regulator
MSAPLPKHVEIAETLIRRITAGILADGARLPPERKMAAGCGVAVGTLRKALALLEQQEMLDRVQGSGNYVRRRPAPSSVYGLFRLELIEGGGLPTAQVLAVDRVARPAGLPGDTSDGPLATRIRRLRRLDGRPVAVEEIWYLGPGAPSAGDLSDSLYLTWQRLFGLTVMQVEDRVGLAGFPGWTPPGQTFAAGGPACHVARKTWGGEALIEVSETWFDAASARFVAREGSV